MTRAQRVLRSSQWYQGEPLYRADYMRVRALPYRRSSRRSSSSSSSSTMGSSLSRSVKTVRSDGNGNVETSVSLGTGDPTSEELRPPVRVELLCDQPRDTREEQAKHAWNNRDRSLNIFVKEDCVFTFHRHPVAQSTDCIRGKQGYSEGLHLIEFTWPSKQRGTHAVIGVATSQAPLHSPGYQSLVGTTSDSWGWDLGRCKAYHDSAKLAGTPYPTSSLPTVPDTILMLLDMDLGTMSFMVNDRYLGVAFSGLRGKTLFPIVSSVWGHCEVTMKHLGSTTGDPPSLSACCRRTIRSAVGREGVARGDMSKLGLPNTIRDYLNYL